MGVEYDVAYIGFGGVIIGASIGMGKDLLMVYLSRQKNATYLAVRISCLLDRYVAGCVEVVGDNGFSYGQIKAGAYAEALVSTPALKIQDMDVDWKVLPSNLMYEILSFPNFIEEADAVISSAFDHANPPDLSEGFEERQDQYAKLGIKAASLAKKLRDKYKLPKHEYENWNPVEYMEEEKKKIINRRTARAEQHKKIFNFNT